MTVSAPGHLLHFPDLDRQRVEVGLVEGLRPAFLHRLLLAITQLVELAQRLSARRSQTAAMPVGLVPQHRDQGDLVDHLVACPCSIHVCS